MRRLGIGWELSSVTGWGVLASNISRQLMRRRDGISPAFLRAPAQFYFSDDADEQRFTPLLRDAEIRVRAALQRYDTGQSTQLDFPVLQQVLDDFHPGSAADVFRGAPDIAYMFFENTRFSAEGKRRAKRYRHIITGSQWNHDVLAAEGVGNLSLIHQGIDGAVFKPRPKSGQFGDRFVVFSGGKLEWRKGHDLVIAAFKEFLHTDPDALLVTAWHNMWPEKRAGLDRDGLVTRPPVTQAPPDMTGWLGENGIPTRNVHDLGMVANQRIPAVLNEADCAIFASRYESGTNLAAMEAMACGVPIILSSNTGHLDLIAKDHCIALNHQRPIPAPVPGMGTDGWGVSAVEEIAEALKTLAFNPSLRLSLGDKAAVFMRDWDWSHQVDAMVRVLRPLT